MKTSRLALLHIKDHIERIQKRTSAGREDFFRSDTLVDAVIRSFEVIGEAVKILPADMRGRHSHVPWQKITDFRNRLIHKYFDIDWDILWIAPQDELDVLAKAIDTELNRKEINSP